MTSWPQNAYVGQKVVCIKQPKYKNHPVPIIGSIYEMRSIFKWNGIGIRLIGLELPPNVIACEDLNIGDECGWDITFFKPAQSTEKGMSILKEILIMQKVKEDA